jgi:mRNA-degrading endonuclease RelE of RelBE toxin-antitoxin system
VPFPVVFKPEAARDLARLPRSAQLRFLFAFGVVSVSPTRPSPQLLIKQLRGRPGFWRVTVGRWRGIYHFDGKCVRFFMFGERATVYQQFESRKRPRV